MSAIAIHTEDNALLCFLLIQDSESINQVDNERDCILTSPPGRSSDFEHPLVIARQKYHHIEHKALYTLHEKGRMIEIAVADLGVLTLHFSDPDIGSWTYSGSFGICSGICRIAKSNRANKRGNTTA
jgi:hypothetical protein